MNSSLRLTPRASPAPRTPNARSPIKTIREEPQCLSLRKVIGTTVTSNNAVSHVDSLHIVAYTAGATAVVVAVGDNLNITQRTFRAKPSSSAGPTQLTALESPTPLAAVQRSRASALPRDLVNSPLTFGSPLNDPPDSSNARVAALKAKSKAATCVSLSQDGRWLAMGESGYKPRVHIFEASKESRNFESPVCSLTEHSFGVKSVAFSPDCRFLASLGDINDGFLFIWTIHEKTGAATLHASNKCTNNVKAMAWAGNNLITVGTRHVKIWRVDHSPQVSPSKRFDATFTLASPSKTLPGRNCILGPLLDKTYTSVVPLDSKRAFVCSDEGDVCLIEESDAGPSIHKVASVDSAIVSACILGGDDYWICTQQSGIKSVKITSLLQVHAGSDQLAELEGLPIIQPELAGPVALTTLRGSLLVFCSNGCIRIEAAEGLGDATNALQVIQHQLSAHGSSLRGLKAVSLAEYPNAAFSSFAADGKVVIWDFAGCPLREVELPLSSHTTGLGAPRNELKAVAILSEGEIIYYGDNEGQVKSFNIARSENTLATKAHAAEITSLDVCETDTATLLASASRDRTVQIFHAERGSLELLQTLEDHVGAVTTVRFSSDGRNLISCSADRSILVRTMVKGEIDGTERTAYVDQRTITLKASPLSLDIFTQDMSEHFVVSCMDKSVQVYSFDDNAIAESFKVGDDDDGDLVSLNCITPVPISKTKHAIAGIASSDKSVRLYSEHGNLLGRAFGHTEGLTGIAPLRQMDWPSETGLVTAATDGTIFLWSLSHPSDTFSASQEASTPSQPISASPGLFPTRPPFRKILSSSEVTQLQNSSDDTPTVAGAGHTRSRSPRRKQGKPSVRETIESGAAPPPLTSRRAKNASEPPDGSSAGDRRGMQSRPNSPPISPRKPHQSRTLPKQVRRRSSQPALSSLHKKNRDDRMPASPPPAQATSTSSDLVGSTHQICRALHAYRKRLAASGEPLPVEHVRELERELSQTAKALAEKAARSEAVMEKLLDRYGERLVEIMERRIDEKVSKLVEEGLTLRKPEPREDAKSP